VFLTVAARSTLGAAVERMAPSDAAHPGADVLGAVDYIEQILDAFSHDPPKIWAGGPFSGRAGGAGSFEQFEQLTERETLVWRTRIEGSSRVPEREWNGPIKGWQQIYSEGLESLGADFDQLAPDHQDARLDDASEDFRRLLHEHVCEACYGAPEYGGNIDGRGWAAIGWPGDTQPRGFTDDEVSGRD
jgi:hypothetical protein